MSTETAIDEAKRFVKQHQLNEELVPALAAVLDKVFDQGLHWQRIRLAVAGEARALELIRPPKLA